MDDKLHDFFLNTVNTNGPFVRKVIISSSVMVVISIQAEYSHTQITDRTATQCCIYLKIKQALFLLIGLCHQIIPLCNTSHKVNLVQVQLQLANKLPLSAHEGDIVLHRKVQFSLD